MKEIETVILAGGKGSRMGELTAHTQKCMLPFKGKPILQHVLDDISTAFITGNVVVALGHEASTVKDYFGDKYKQLNLFYVENPESLETKKRLLLARDLVSADFLFLAGDVIASADQLSRIFERAKADEKIFGVVSGASDHSPALGHPLVKLSGNYVENMYFPPPQEWESVDRRDMQICFFKSDFFDYAARSKKLYISQVISEIILEKGLNSVGCESYEGKWKHFADSKDLS